MPDRYFWDAGAKTEMINYAPGCPHSGNLGNKTVTATAEPVAPDFSASLTLPAPADSRFNVLRVGTRSSLTVDTFNGGCTQLRCRIYVDLQQANNLLHDITISGTGNALTTQDCFSTTKTAIFELLKDGQPHTFLFYLWVNAGNAVISQAQVWEGVGTSLATVSPMPRIINFASEGLVEMDCQYSGIVPGVLAGTFLRMYTTMVQINGTLTGGDSYAYCSSALRINSPAAPVTSCARLTTTTGLCFLLNMWVMTRSE